MGTNSDDFIFMNSDKFTSLSNDLDFVRKYFVFYNKTTKWLSKVQYKNKTNVLGGYKIFEFWTKVELLIRRLTDHTFPIR